MGCTAVLSLDSFGFEFKSGLRAQVFLRADRLVNKSYNMVYAIVRKSDKLLCVEGKTVQVMYDYHEVWSIPIPPDFQKIVSRYEPGLSAPADQPGWPGMLQPVLTNCVH